MSVSLQCVFIVLDLKLSKVEYMLIFFMPVRQGMNLGQRNNLRDLYLSI